jgi:hypothetical protein
MEVRRGHWLYAGNVQCPVRISRRDVWPGSGDYEDATEVMENREMECYELEFHTPVGSPPWVGGGVYATQEEAAEAARRLLGESLHWQP